VFSGFGVLFGHSRAFAYFSGRVRGRLGSSLGDQVGVGSGVALRRTCALMTA